MEIIRKLKNLYSDVFVWLEDWWNCKSKFCKERRKDHYNKTKSLFILHNVDYNEHVIVLKLLQHLMDSFYSSCKGKIKNIKPTKINVEDIWVHKLKRKLLDRCQQLINFSLLLNKLNDNLEFTFMDIADDEPGKNAEINDPYELEQRLSENISTEEFEYIINRMNFELINQYPEIRSRLEYLANKYLNSLSNYEKEFVQSCKYSCLIVNTTFSRFSAFYRKVERKSYYVVGFSNTRLRNKIIRILRFTAVLKNKLSNLYSEFVKKLEKEEPNLELDDNDLPKAIPIDENNEEEDFVFDDNEDDNEVTAEKIEHLLKKFWNRKDLLEAFRDAHNKIIETTLNEFDWSENDYS